MQRGLILVGAFGSAIGLKGEVRLVSFTEDPQAITRYGPLYAEDGRAFEILSLRAQKDAFAARVKGIATRDAAEALKGIGLHVAREKLAAAAEKADYLHADLIGLSAVTREGAALGEIVSVQNFGAGDLLELKLAGESRTAYVPFTHAIVPEVDLKARQVVIDPPPGLMDDPGKAARDESE